jgi:hypothetical protein
VAHRGLLVLLGVVADLEGGRPRNMGEIKDPGVIIPGIPQ